MQPIQKTCLEPMDLKEIMFIGSWFIKRLRFFRSCSISQDNAFGELLSFIGDSISKAARVVFALRFYATYSFLPAKMRDSIFTGGCFAFWIVFSKITEVCRIGFKTACLMSALFDEG